MDRPHLHDLRQKILVTTLPLLYCLRHCLCCTVKDTASAVLSKTLPLPCVLPLPFVAKTLPFLADFQKVIAKPKDKSIKIHGDEVGHRFYFDTIVACLNTPPG